MKITFATLILPSLLLGGGIASGNSASEAVLSEEDERIEAWLRGDDLQNVDIPELDDLLEPLPLWDVETTLNTGIGYRDNVMLSAVEPEGGSFLLGGFDAMFLRIPEEGPRFSLFLDAEHLEFFNNRDLPNDTFLGAHSRITFPLPQDSALSFGLSGFYIDQMIDVATHDVPVEPIRVRGHGITLDSSLEREWRHHFFTEASVSGSRQEFRSPLHDYWEYGPKLAAGWSPPDSKISFSLEFLERVYDDRRARSGDGNNIPGSDLKFHLLRPQFDLHHAWGEGWHSRSQVRLEFNRDNESDYFAYDRIRLTQQLGYRADAWEIRGRVRYSFYDYKVQQVAPSGDRRHRHSLGIGLEARRQLADALDIFARYDREEVFSNDQGSDYEVNTWTVGLGWTF